MKINQLKAGVILSYLSQGIHILIGIVYTPVMLRLLGQSEYGLYQLVGSVISYLSLLSLGFGSSYVRYYSKYKVSNDTDGIAKLNGMFMTVFAVIGLISLTAGGILIGNVENMFSKSLSVEELHTTKILMAIMVFNLSISFPGSVFSSYITANEQYIFQRTVSILSHILNPFLTLPLLLFGYKSIAVVCIQTVISISSFVANIVFCRKKLGISFDFKGFKPKFLKELFMFSFWIFLNQIIDQINWNIGKFILGIFSGAVSVAVFGVASQLNNLYIGFSTIISNVFAPKINRLVAKNNNNSELTSLFTRVGRIQFIVLTLIVSGLIIFGQYFIEIWAGEGYGDSYIITMLLIIPATPPLIQSLGIEIQRAKNMHQFRSIVYAIIAVANVCISIPLSQLYGGIGAAMGTAISLFVGNGLIMNIYYHKKIGLDIIYFWKQILKFVPAMIIPILFGIYIAKNIKYNNLFEFVGFIALYSVIYCTCMWFLGMNNEEKSLISNPVRKILHRGKKNA